MSKRQERLKTALKRELQNYRNPYHLATANGISHGLIYRCLDGGYSPTLYKIFVRNEPRKRQRLIVEIDPARFDAQRAEHGMSRAEYQVYLMALDRMPY